MDGQSDSSLIPIPPNNFVTGVYIAELLSIRASANEI
jgi:hypothetical protein